MHPHPSTKARADKPNPERKNFFPEYSVLYLLLVLLYELNNYYILKQKNNT